MRKIWYRCLFCKDILYVDDLDAFYVVHKNVTYKGKKFKGGRTYFHKDCYEKILRKNNKNAGVAQ